MGKNRVRFNERARAAKKGQKPVAAEVPEYDPNAAILDPTVLAKVSEVSKPKDEPLPEGMSKKKRKRFEQFVAKKEKKEERVQLLEKLSTSSFDHQLLQSSARLGTAKLSKKEALSRALLEEKMGLTPSVDLYVHRKHEAKQAEDAAEDAMDVDFAPSSSSRSAVQTVDFSGPGVKSIVSLGASANSSDLDEVTDAPPSKKRKKNKKRKSETPDEPALAAGSSCRIDDSDSDMEPIPVISGGSTKQKVYVIPDRDPAIAEARMNLPVVQEEDRVMETINSNSVTVLCGETGSGKTTQVPQFLYEAGFSHAESDFPGLIGVTQPRRVAAVSMSQRVGQELNRIDHVSYQIRFEKTTNPNTRIHFMTDGVLLKEVSQDLLLSKYSVMIVDEAHERNMNTDILIGVLSRVVTLRETLSKEWAAKKATAERLGTPFSDPRVTPLKLIIMSATLRVSDFTLNTRLFPMPPPVINVQARQFPVTVHFNRRTPDNHILEAYKKVCKIHKRLPPGGILVFMTGQNEIYDLVNRLKKKFPAKEAAAVEVEPVTGSAKGKRGKKGKAVQPPSKVAIVHDEPKDDASATLEDRMAEMDTGLVRRATVSSEARAVESQSKRGDTVQLKPTEGLSAPSPASAAGTEAEEDLEEFLLSEDEDDMDADLDDDFDPAERDDYADGDSDDDDDEPAAPLHVLPLYSLLSTDQQMRVFDKVPEGHRLCVVATNVAETSLTIPGIRYVVDCGKVKEKVYDSSTSIQNFVVNWTSKASADQRAGRAGRTGPGHCYRLFSSAVYEHQFQQFSDPEVLRMPIEGVVLQLKAMNIDNVINFPFPTPPNRSDLAKAEKMLQSLGALDANGKVTPVGVKMSQLPIHPRFAKMLLLGMQGGLIEYAIAVVAALSVGEMFVSMTELQRAAQEEGDGSKKPPEAKSEEEEEGKDDGAEEGQGAKEMLMAKVINKFAGPKRTSDALFYLNLVGAFEYAGGSPQFCQQNHLRLKAMLEIRALRKQLTAMVQTINPSLTVTMNPRMAPPSETQTILLRQLLLAGFADHLAIPHPNPPILYGNGPKRVFFQTMLNDQPTCIERTSLLASHRPEALVFTHLQQGTSFVWMKCVTAVDLEWVASVCKPMCVFGKPMEIPPPKYDAKSDTIMANVVPTIGTHAWELPMTVMPLTKAPAVYLWFARFLLEGIILPALKPLAPHFSTQPQCLTKETYRGQKKVVELSQQLIGKHVHSKSALLKQWAVNPRYLLDAVLLWVNPEVADQVRAQWPPTKKPLKFV
ncbi:P-loop containing nucleoside triphosphate hydrolase protein [Catenaria anguillulae PL171]|uniref:RNA helicase n=1 Tax=Catenaria anguillulae PL171 TaxID=765915 RepID=A0A1Y2HNK1_9FUNG|nr:P-loop containing nucleoside triphosphate hydrolase protein [Catenaria anguillulae PL171]